MFKQINQEYTSSLILPSKSKTLVITFEFAYTAQCIREKICKDRKIIDFFFIRFKKSDIDTIKVKAFGNPERMLH